MPPLMDRLEHGQSKGRSKGMEGMVDDVGLPIGHAVSRGCGYACMI